MSKYLIMYKTSTGEAEYWVYADCASTARVLFRNDFLRGDLDYPTDGTILSVREVQ